MSVYVCVCVCAHVYLHVSLSHIYMCVCMCGMCGMCMYGMCVYVWYVCVVCVCVVCVCVCVCMWCVCVSVWKQGKYSYCCCNRHFVWPLSSNVHNVNEPLINWIKSYIAHTHTHTHTHTQRERERERERVWVLFWVSSANPNQGKNRQGCNHFCTKTLPVSMPLLFRKKIELSIVSEWHWQIHQSTTMD